MDLNLYENYIYTRKLDLDLEQQRSNAHSIHDNLIKKYFDKPSRYQGGSLVTQYYPYYNYLNYKFPGTVKLFNCIRETFIAANNNEWGNTPPDNEFYIQCWLNYYNKGESIDWHNHLPLEARGWHGFYCVDVEPNSSTIYRLDNTEITVKSENNLLVLSKSGRDLHKSSEWLEDNPRITIAFDIAPVQLFSKDPTETNTDDFVHHYWIPLVTL